MSIDSSRDLPIRRRANVSFAAAWLAFSFALGCSGGASGGGPATARCGDGIVQGDEACDDGNTIDTDACLTTCVAARCGDGIVQAGVEACDDGNAIDTDACLTTCVAARCGDGIVQGDEACDDGNAIDTDACLTTCVAARCGDGYVQDGIEACDDGNTIDTDACLTTCVAARCGDGYVETGVEACDDGNAIDTDACLTTCVAARCGDGFVQGVEACDDGNAIDSDACLTTCVAARCGDGYVEAGIEACDDGGANSDLAPDACRTSCRRPSCGDGVVDAGESCDTGGESIACDADCTATSCGDGYLNLTAGEECDDGNTVSGDGCSLICKAESRPIHVRTGATGANDGTSWTNAFTSLQDALAAAGAGDELWVAAGTYTPDHGLGRTAGDRTQSFALKNGVAVYGGFAGTERVLTQRDWSANPSVLSGDIGVSGYASDNSLHVVANKNVDGTAVLDGFTIRDGYASAVPAPGYHGAGMYNDTSSPTIVNCAFEQNVAVVSVYGEVRGGAMHNLASSPTIRSCTFTGNRVENKQTFGSYCSSCAALGGAIYDDGTSHPHVSDSVFTGNVAKVANGNAIGGAVFIGGGDPWFVRSQFTDNLATSGTYARGGAIGSDGPNYPAYASVSFARNTASGVQAAMGGALYDTYSTPAIVNCLFDSNLATSSGGAGYGGAIYQDSGIPSIRSSTFVWNATTSVTGADKGAVMYDTLSAPEIVNSVVWGNVSSGPQIDWMDKTLAAHVYRSCVEGGFVGNGNVTLTSSPFSSGTIYRLAAGSVCSDAATTSWLPADQWDLDSDGVTTETLPVDLAGGPRVVDDPAAVNVGGALDMGAYEGQ